MAGAIILGKDPTQLVPGAYMQVTRVDGTGLDAPILDDKRLSDPLPPLLRELDQYLRISIRTGVEIGSGPRDERHADYPEKALQQLVRNALMHRSYEGTNAPVRLTWYSDRIELVSPGGPYGIVTPENFGSPGVTDYRNPTLAEAMRALGYVQRFGAGLPIARTESARNGNPPPEFTPDQTYVAVVLGSAA